MRLAGRGEDNDGEYVCGDYRVQPRHFFMEEAEVACRERTGHPYVYSSPP